MANPSDPNEPFLADRPSENSRGETSRGPARLDSEMQVDPELAEGPAGGNRIAIFAVAIAVVLGAVFYGLNNSSVNPGGTGKSEDRTAAVNPPTSPDATAVNAPAQKPTDASAQKPADQAAQSAPATPPAAGINNTPNHQSGVTTGTAPVKPQAPASAPTGQEIDRSAAPDAPTSGSTTK